jgi:hypothetical protein
MQKFPVGAISIERWVFVSFNDLNETTRLQKSSISHLPWDGE